MAHQAQDRRDAFRCRRDQRLCDLEGPRDPPGPGEDDSAQPQALVVATPSPSTPVAATPVAVVEKAPEPVTAPAKPRATPFPPGFFDPPKVAANPPPSTDDPVAFETALRSYAWIGKGTVLDHQVSKDNPMPPRSRRRVDLTYHWWVTGPRTIHVQFAAIAGEIRSQDRWPGGFWEPSMMTYHPLESDKSDKVIGYREHFLPQVARQLMLTPPTPQLRAQAPALKPRTRALIFPAAPDRLPAGRSLTPLRQPFFPFPLMNPHSPLSLDRRTFLGTTAAAASAPPLASACNPAVKRTPAQGRRSRWSAAAGAARARPARR